MSLRPSTLVVAAISCGIAIVLACLPDLEIATTVPPGCGDGVVELDLGEQCDPGDAGDQTGCSAGCTMICDGGFVQGVSNHCYFWTTPTTTLAEERCPPGSHVVTFGSLEELIFVTNEDKAHDAGNIRAWSDLILTGNNDAGTPTFLQGKPPLLEPGWSRDCAGCYASIEAGATYFPSTNDASAPESCVSWLVESYTKTWNRSSCDLGFTDGAPNNRPVLCEREPAGSFAQHCDAGVCIVLPYTFNQKTYALVKDPALADSAEAICLSRQGRLVVFADREEREQLAAEIARAGVSEVWIGLSSDADGGWSWDDGKPLAAHPAPWGDLEPAGAARAFLRIDPASYDTRLAHADDDTGAVRAFVCELTP